MPSQCFGKISEGEIWQDGTLEKFQKVKLVRLVLRKNFRGLKWVGLVPWKNFRRQNGSSWCFGKISEG